MYQVSNLRVCGTDEDNCSRNVALMNRNWIQSRGTPAITTARDGESGGGGFRDHVEGLSRDRFLSSSFLRIVSVTVSKVESKIVPIKTV